MLSAALMLMNEERMYTFDKKMLTRIMYGQGGWVGGLERTGLSEQQREEEEKEEDWKLGQMTTTV